MIHAAWLIPAFLVGAALGALAMGWALFDLKLRADDARDYGRRL